MCVYALNLPNQTRASATRTAFDKITEGIHIRRFLSPVSDKGLQVKLLAKYLQQTQLEPCQGVVTDQCTDIVLIEYNGMLEVDVGENLFSRFAKINLLINQLRTTVDELLPLACQKWTWSVAPSGIPLAWRDVYRRSSRRVSFPWLRCRGGVFALFPEGE